MLVGLGIFLAGAGVFLAGLGCFWSAVDGDGHGVDRHVVMRGGPGMRGELGLGRGGGGTFGFRSGGRGGATWGGRFDMAKPAAPGATTSPAPAAPGAAGGQSSNSAPAR
jgi:hypothetical protein